MKYFLAILVCCTELIVHAVICVLLGWKRGGGLIPMLIFYAIVAWTWRTITKPKQAGAAVPDESTQNPSLKTEKAK